MTTNDTPEPAAHAPSRATALPETTSLTGLLVGLALGLPVIAYGMGGVLVDDADTHPAELARWVVGAAIVNDFLVLPIAIVVAFVLRRVVPATVWPPVRAGLLCSAVLCAVAWPLVRGYGEDPANPSLFPRNYGAGLVAALGVVWVCVLAWCVLGRAVRR
jgi:hypothetical protein